MANSKKKTRTVPRPVSSDDDLQKASDHLHYEVWMLEECADELDALRDVPETDEKRQLRVNVHLETFVMKARQLRDFLENKFHYDTDMIARDYLSAQTALTPIDPDVLEAIERSDTEIAHLTFERLRVPDKRWQVERIRSVIIDRMREFIDKVKAAGRGAVLGERLSTWSPKFPAALLRSSAFNIANSLGSNATSHASLGTAMPTGSSFSDGPKGGPLGPPGAVGPSAPPPPKPGNQATGGPDKS